METKNCVRRLILDKLSENLILIDSEEGNWLFVGGGAMSLPLVFGAQKAWLGLG